MNKYGIKRIEAYYNCDLSKEYALLSSENGVPNGAKLELKRDTAGNLAIAVECNGFDWFYTSQDVINFIETADERKFTVEDRLNISNFF